MAQHLGGRVEPSTHREYGAATVNKTLAGKTDPLTDAAVDPTTPVWMSHGDSVVALPPGPSSFSSRRANQPALRCLLVGCGACSFTPRSITPPRASCCSKPSPATSADSLPTGTCAPSCPRSKPSSLPSFTDVGEVVCAVSGGVDSTVLAVLLSQVCKVRALFVDHGFLRAYDLPTSSGCSKTFPASRSRWSMPRRASGPLSRESAIRSRSANHRQAVCQDLRRPCRRETQFYPPGAGHDLFRRDRVSNAAVHGGAAHIKSHHNVGGFPAGCAGAARRAAAPVFQRRGPRAGRAARH
jgi:GMP synthase (glutamine-hydrolysing)